MPKRKMATKLLKRAVSSRIDPDLHKRLMKLAKDEKLTVSQCIEEIIAARLPPQPAA